MVMKLPQVNAASPDGIEVVDTRPDRSKPKEYGEFECLLDRILVRRIVQDNAEGFAVADKYRQSSNWGEVIAIGDSVVLGGQRIPLSEFVGVGDLVKYGEHTAEQFDTNDPELYIVRIQDLRGRRRLVKACLHRWTPVEGRSFEACMLCGARKEKS